MKGMRDEDMKEIILQLISEDLRERTIELEAELAARNEELSCEEKKRREVESNLSTVSEDVQRQAVQQGNMEAELSALRNQMEQTTAAHHAELCATRESLASTQKELKESDAAKVELITELAAAKAAHETLMGRVNQLQHAESEKETTAQALQTELRLLEARKGALEGEHQRLDEELGAAQMRNEQLSQMVSQLQADGAHSADTIAQLTATVSAEQVKCRQLACAKEGVETELSAHQAVSAETVATLEKLVANANAALAESERRLRDLSNEAAAHVHEAAAKSVELATARAEFDRTRQEWEEQLLRLQAQEGAVLQRNEQLAEEAVQMVCLFAFSSLPSSPCRHSPSSGSRARRSRCYRRCRRSRRQRPPSQNATARTSSSRSPSRRRRSTR
jgi:chromosome segregation ATPase